MAERSPRQHFLEITFEIIMHDNAQDEYVQAMVQGIYDFVADDRKWKKLSEEEREESEQLLKVVNDQMAKVVESKEAVPHPETGEAMSITDTHATQTYRGGLINALFRLRTKAEKAAKEG
jgi:hypothetical protein